MNCDLMWLRKKVGREPVIEKKMTILTKILNENFAE